MNDDLRTMLAADLDTGRQLIAPDAPQLDQAAVDTWVDTVTLDLGPVDPDVATRFTVAVTVEFSPGQQDALAALDDPNAFLRTRVQILCGTLETIIALLDNEEPAP